MNSVKRTKDEATLTVKDASGKEHVIRSTTFGINAIVDCLQRLSELERALAEREGKVH